MWGLWWQWYHFKLVWGYWASSGCHQLVWLLGILGCLWRQHKVMTVFIAVLGEVELPLACGGKLWRVAAGGGMNSLSAYGIVMSLSSFFRQWRQAHLYWRLGLQLCGVAWWGYTGGAFWGVRGYRLGLRVVHWWMFHPCELLEMRPPGSELGQTGGPRYSRRALAGATGEGLCWPVAVPPPWGQCHSLVFWSGARGWQGGMRLGRLGRWGRRCLSPRVHRILCHGRA